MFSDCPLRMHQSNENLFIDEHNLWTAEKTQFQQVSFKNDVVDKSQNVLSGISLVPEVIA